MWYIAWSVPIAAAVEDMRKLECPCYKHQLVEDTTWVSVLPDCLLCEYQMVPIQSTPPLHIYSNQSNCQNNLPVFAKYLFTEALSVTFMYISYPEQVHIWGNTDLEDNNNNEIHTTVKKCE